MRSIQNVRSFEVNPTNHIASNMHIVDIKVFIIKEFQVLLHINEIERGIGVPTNVTSRTLIITFFV